MMDHMQDDPTPYQRLEEGQVLRRTEKGVVVERWVVPATLRLLPIDVRELRRMGFRYP